MIVTFIRVRLLHSLRFLLVVSLLALPWWTASRCLGQDKSPQTEEERQARQDLNEGVQAFKNGQYQEAERYFAHAKQLYPKLLNARLYLATTYASQYIPGAPSEENIRMGHAATEEFRGVLSLDPQTICANGLLRTKFNLSVKGRQLSDDAQLPPDLRDEYVREYGASIDDGINSLNRAILIKPDYDDAMAYLNLLYRRKADTVASETERAQLIKMADDLIDKVKDIKQKRAELP